MVHRRYQNLPIECWLHGRLGWSPQSLCIFHADKSAGAALLAALDELTADESVDRLTLSFHESSRAGCVRTFRLQRVAECDQLKVMHLACDGERATLEMTSLGLFCVRTNVQTWLNGGEDFCVHPGHARVGRRELRERDKTSLELWFWGPTYEP